MKTNPDRIRARAGFWLAALCALGLVAGTTGCLVIPTPHVDSGYARTNINQEVVGQFTPGETTREDVIARLGEPDAVSPDERQLAYRSEKVVALWMFAVGSQGAGTATGGTIYHNRFWSFEFDAQGRLQKVTGTARLGSVVGTHEPALSQPIPPGQVDSGDTPAWLGGRAWRVYRQTAWYGGMDGFKGKGALSAPGVLGTLIVTDSNLCFVTKAQLANAGPQLKLALDTVTDVQVDKWFLARRLVVRTTDGVHSFSLTAPDGIWQDRQGMQDLCDFIRLKIPSTRPESWNGASP